jgi:hypothetical protein
MNKVIICENILEPQSWETTHGVGDVREFLKHRFAEWPQTARIYHNEVADAYEVTPHNEAEVDRLGQLEGTFYVVVYPEGIETIFIISRNCNCCGCNWPVVLAPAINAECKESARDFA